MNVLLLSCGTGEGHNTAARALCQRILSEGSHAAVVDVARLKSPGTAKAVDEVYIRTAKYAPRLFGAAYRLGGALSRPDRRSPVYYANTRLGRYLLGYLACHPCDAILTTHLYGAEVVTGLKRQGRLALPCLAVATDYTCIPFWEETRCDGYVLGHPDLMGEFVNHGVPADKLFALGIPVSDAYTRPRDPGAARQALGLTAGGPLYLVMGGSMGFGRMGTFTRALAAGDVNVRTCPSMPYQKALHRLF